MRKAVLMLVCVAGVSAPALANHDKKPVDPNKKVCRRITDTGSITSHSICHTAAEWVQIDSQNSKRADDMLNQHPNATQPD